MPPRAGAATDDADVRLGVDFGDKLPSGFFDEHVLTCFIDDKFGVASRDFLNMDHVMWECDHPHSGKHAARAVDLGTPAAR